MSDLNSVKREIEAEARRLFPGAVRRVELKQLKERSGGEHERDKHKSARDETDDRLRHPLPKQTVDHKSGCRKERNQPNQI